MATSICLFFANIIVLNAAFLLSFYVRYGDDIPKYCFSAYKNTFVFLTVIQMLALASFGVYRHRFRSSWNLFRRIVSGLFFGTLFSVAFVYVFRVRWGAFPTSVFALAFMINLLLVFKLNQYILRLKKRIKKKVVVVSDSDVDDIAGRKTVVKKIGSNEIRKLLGYTDMDAVIICERIQSEKDLSLILYLIQKLRIEVVFDPSIYVELLSGRINGDDSFGFLSTFVGGKRDAEEFMMRGLDILGSVLILLVSAPALIVVCLLIEVTSSGSVFYKQQRVGKDGKIFTLYKFRTMVKDAEKGVGPVLAKRNDPRVTKIGKLLRKTRLDEIPQLINVLCGDMSLVGPRPERPHFVKQHKVLHELRLAVKPGLTGLAQVRSFYDLKPQHKIKYDYLYIQKRSLLLNIYILAMTIPAIFSKKGW